ncbi:MAG: hypothetical protein NVV62_14360 [Terricaulis sp.]|nr:hypothetical protein [Terricaulis sp.]
MRALAFIAALLMAPAAYAEPVRYVLDSAHTQVAFSIEAVRLQQRAGPVRPG